MEEIKKATAREANGKTVIPLDSVTRDRIPLKKGLKGYFSSDMSFYEEDIIQNFVFAYPTEVFYSIETKEDDFDSFMDEDYLSPLLGMDYFIIFFNPFSLGKLKCHRKMMIEFEFASKHNIPCLFVHCEINENKNELLANAEAYFGPRQFLSIYGIGGKLLDRATLSCRNKIAIALSRLADDDLHRSLDKIFQKKAFLSYRKKDRQFIAPILKLFHSDVGTQSLRIWYDEFLSGGEEYSSDIEKELTDADVFMLLITPSLLEKDNFVMRVEYPLAKKLGKKIFPILVANTDLDLLKEYYPGLPQIHEFDRIGFYELLYGGFNSYPPREEEEKAQYYLTLGKCFRDGMEMETDYDLAESMFLSSALSSTQCHAIPEGYHELSKLYKDELFKGENLDLALRYQELYLDGLLKNLNLGDAQERYRYLNACLEYGEILLEGNRHSGYFDFVRAEIERMEPYEESALLKLVKVTNIRRFRTGSDLIDQLDEIKEPLFILCQKHADLKPYIGLYYFELSKCYRKARDEENERKYGEMGLFFDCDYLNKPGIELYTNKIAYYLQSVECEDFDKDKRLYELTLKAGYATVWRFHFERDCQDFRYFREKIAALVYRDFDLYFRYGKYLRLGYDDKRYLQKSMFYYEYLNRYIAAKNQFFFNECNGQYRERVIDDSLPLARLLYLDEPSSYTYEFLNHFLRIASEWEERGRHDKEEPLRRELLIVAKARSIDFLTARFYHELSLCLINQKKTEEAKSTLEKGIAFIDALNEKTYASVSDRRRKMIELLAELS